MSVQAGPAGTPPLAETRSRVPGRPRCSRLRATPGPFPGHLTFAGLPDSMPASMTRRDTPGSGRVGQMALRDHFDERAAGQPEARGFLVDRGEDARVDGEIGFCRPA